MMNRKSWLFLFIFLSICCLLLASLLGLLGTLLPRIAAKIPPTAIIPEASLTAIAQETLPTTIVQEAFPTANAQEMLPTATIQAASPTPVQFKRTGPAAILYVKAKAIGTCSSWADACELSAALQVAESGDEIWVVRGIHTPIPWQTDVRNATFQLKDGVAVYGGFAGNETTRDQRDFASRITVLSGDLDGNDAADPNGVVASTKNIQGSNAYHVIIGSGVTSAAILDGFTITAGNADGSPGTPASLGGGMYSNHGSQTLANIIFSGNNAYQGGGMYNETGSPSLDHVTFESNLASDGGGMYSWHDSNPTLTYVTFNHNAAYTGGGMFTTFGDATLINVTFSHNSADGGGGGMYSSGRSTLTNVAFSKNTAGFFGGGLYNLSSSPTLTNVSFSSNSANYNGGGIFNFQGSNPTLINTILWGNRAETDPQISNNNSDGDSSTATLKYSLVEGGCPERSACDEHLLTVDPLFVHTDSGNLHLQSRSPVIDAGNNTVPGLGAIATDLDGDPRFFDVPGIPDTGNGTLPIIDLGAYEYDTGEPARSPILYVKPAATGNCSSWVNACDLPAALVASTSGDEIWVMQGIYKPITNEEDPRHATFQLKDGVALYGGFTGNEREREERDFANNTTVFSGDLDRNDIADPNGTVTTTNNITGKNAYHVVTGSNVVATAVLDGFTITAGMADGEYPSGYGGGMYNDHGSPTLNHITFSGNSAEDGGGMYNANYSNPTLNDVTFNDNTAEYGGGMYNVYDSGPTLKNVRFNHNSANNGGGMNNNNRSSPILNDVTFNNNSAEFGGGMFNGDNITTLNNVTFRSNTARFCGGMSNDNSSLTLNNVTFNGNSAEYDGGGMCNDNSSLALTNVTFNENAASRYGGGIYNNSSKPVLTDVTFDGNTAKEGSDTYNAPNN